MENQIKININSKESALFEYKKQVEDNLNNYDFFMNLKNEYFSLGLFKAMDECNEKCLTLSSNNIKNTEITEKMNSMFQTLPDNELCYILNRLIEEDILEYVLNTPAKKLSFNTIVKTLSKTSKIYFKTDYLALFFDDVMSVFKDKGEYLFKEWLNINKNHVEITLWPFKEYLSTKRGTDVFLQNINKDKIYVNVWNMLNYEHVDSNSLNKILAAVATKNNKCLNYLNQSLSVNNTYSFLPIKVKNWIIKNNYIDELTEMEKKRYFNVIYELLPQSEIIKILEKDYLNMTNQIKNLNESQWIELITKIPEAILIVPKNIKKIEFINKVVNCTNSFGFLTTDELSDVKVMETLLSLKNLKYEFLLQALNEDLIKSNKKFIEIFETVVKNERMSFFINNYCLINDIYKDLYRKKGKTSKVIDIIEESFLLMNNAEMYKDIKEMEHNPKRSPYKTKKF